MFKYVVCVAILAVSLKNVWALNDEDKRKIQETFLPHIQECGKELSVPEDALTDAKEKGTTEGIDKCFFACVYKKAGLMDDKGMFNSEKALEEAKKILTDEKDIKTAEEVASDCASVNSENVSDGEAGCERAKLLVSCWFKNKDKIFSRK